MRREPSRNEPCLAQLCQITSCFGGFLGIGVDHYPLPWQSLKYDTNVGGNRTNVTADKLKGCAKV